MKTSYLILLSALIASLTGCASTSSYSSLEANTETEQTETVLIPAGVDSAVAAEAVQLANESFVSFEEEERARIAREQAEAYRAESDTLWYYLSLTPQEGMEISEDDENEATRTYNRGAEFIIEMQNLNQEPGMSQSAMENRHSQLTDLAIDALEESIIINPYDSETRRYLGELYSMKATRLDSEEEHERAIDVLEKLALIEKGEHGIYELLAINYEEVGNYRKAAENYKKARTTLKPIAEMSDYYYENGFYSAEDSLAMHLFAYYEGDAYINLLEPQPALDAMELAKELAPTAEDREIVQSDIDFINWDDGNIAASFARDSLVAIEANGNLNGAETGYLALLNGLKTQKARDHIQWRLSIVQYELGKEEVAADRLMKLVNRTETGPDGLPLDSDYHQYFEDYSTITFNIGLRKLNERETRTALMYLKQAAVIPGQIRARANLQIADILRQNIPEAIMHAKLAEEDAHLLNNQDKNSLYTILTNLHRRDGNMEEARKYLELSRQN